jgi:hypothetical protein
MEALSGHLASAVRGLVRARHRTLASLHFSPGPVPRKFV